MILMLMERMPHNSKQILEQVDLKMLAHGVGLITSVYFEKTVSQGGKYQNGCLPFFLYITIKIFTLVADVLKKGLKMSA